MEASICWTLRKKEEENYPPNIIDSLPFPLSTNIANAHCKFAT
jgi:hypothetical protein